MEQASLYTQLTSSNIGFRLLQKMGWKGKGLGKDEQVSRKWKIDGTMAKKRCILEVEENKRLTPAPIIALASFIYRSTFWTYRTSVLEDLADDFRLSIDHRPTENVNLDGLEQASLDTQLTSSNSGFRLLQKMGWKGKGLGKDEQGIVEPIKSAIRDPKLGIGKQEEDDYFTAEENIQ